MKTLVILALLSVSVGAQGQKATPRRATLAEQKECSEQSAKVFHEHFPDSSEATYTSHYDPEANVCYAYMEQVKKRNGDTAHQVIILDAFENNGYAVFYAPSSSQAPTTCTVLPLGKKDGLECKAKLSSMLLFASITTSSISTGPRLAKHRRYTNDGRIAR